MKFEERVDNEVAQETILYFKVSNEVLEEYTGRTYPDAVSAEVSLTFPLNDLDLEKMNASISPTRYDEEWDAYEEYDWTDVELSEDEVAQLMELFEEATI